MTDKEKAIEWARTELVRCQGCKLLEIHCRDEKYNCIKAIVARELIEAVGKINNQK
jgi:hypothetical protein